MRVWQVVVVVVTWSGRRCLVLHSQSLARSREAGALVIRATSSFLRPWVCRNSRAAWLAKGKPTSSGLTGEVRMTRLSARPLLISRVQAWVLVGCLGGKIRLGSDDFLFEVGSQGGLIVFDGQQIMAPRLRTIVRAV
jgi:hypothetical protein